MKPKAYYRRDSWLSVGYRFFQIKSEFLVYFRIIKCTAKGNCKAIRHLSKTSVEFLFVLFTQIFQKSSCTLETINFY